MTFLLLGLLTIFVARLFFVIFLGYEVKRVDLFAALAIFLLIVISMTIKGA